MRAQAPTCVVFTSATAAAATAAATARASTSLQPPFQGEPCMHGGLTQVNMEGACWTSRWGVWFLWPVRPSAQPAFLDEGGGVHGGIAGALGNQVGRFCVDWDRGHNPPKGTRKVALGKDSIATLRVALHSAGAHNRRSPQASVCWVSQTLRAPGELGRLPPVWPS